MKVAITSNGNSLNSNIDSHFGRCTYFVIYDTLTKSIEFLPNEFKESIEGAGPNAAQVVSSRGVKKVVSGEFGAKVKSIFDSLKIQLIIVSSSKKTISDIISLIDNSKHKD